MAKGGKNLWIFIFIGILVFIFANVLYVVKRGAIYTNKIEHCTKAPPETFCGIKEISLALPDALKQDIMAAVESGMGKRVVLDGWKGGKTISTETVMGRLSDVWTWYEDLPRRIGAEIGEPVSITQSYLPTTCAVIVYDQEGDFINWHYDVNYFEGRFFTLLVPVTFDDVCTKYTYYDKEGAIKEIDNKKDKSILFEGDKVFHMATKLCKGERRVILSMQFATDSKISWYNRALMRIKDSAYIGVF